MQLHAYFYVLNSSVSFAVYEYTLPHTLNRPTQPSPSNPPSFVVAVVERSLSLSVLFYAMMHQTDQYSGNVLLYLKEDQSIRTMLPGKVKKRATATMSPSFL